MSFACPTGRPGVLFDVDGTLVDSVYPHILAWSRAVADSEEWAPMNAIHRLIGMGGEQLAPRLLAHDLDDVDEVRARQYALLVDEVRRFPGARRRQPLGRRGRPRRVVAAILADPVTGRFVRCCRCRAATPPTLTRPHNDQTNDER
jgi:phosphoglycolate phosphatase-like HAD superfamily hydrolase